MQQHELFKSIYASNLKARAINVMSCLITYMNTTDNTCFPAIITIAKCCGMGTTTVKRALDDLVEAGFVVKEARFIESKNGAQTSNLYRLSAVFTAPEPPKDDEPVVEVKDVEYTVVSFDDLKDEGNVAGSADKQSISTADTQSGETTFIIIPKTNKVISVVKQSLNNISVNLQQSISSVQLSLIPP